MSKQALGIGHASSIWHATSPPRGPLVRERLRLSPSRRAAFGMPPGGPLPDLPLPATFPLPVFPLPQAPLLPQAAVPLLRVRDYGKRVRDYGKMGVFGAEFGCESTEKWGENASNFRNLARKSPLRRAGRSSGGTKGGSGPKVGQKGGPEGEKGARREKRDRNRDAGRDGGEVSQRLDPPDGSPGEWMVRRHPADVPFGSP